MILSAHFDLDEMVRSETATRQGIDNTPSPEVINNLRFLCDHVLEPIREAMGIVQVTSGYRCLKLNLAIGGAKTSSHMDGKAADINVKGRSLAELYNWLLKNKDLVKYDQIIREFPPGGWVHVSYDPAKNRREGLLATSVGGKTVYSVQNTPVQS